MGPVPTRPPPGSHLSHAEGARSCPFSSLGGLRLVSVLPLSRPRWPPGRCLFKPAPEQAFVSPIGGEPGSFVPQRVPQSSCAPAHVASIPRKFYQKFERFQFILLSRTWLSLCHATVRGCPTASTSGPQPRALRP